MKYQSSRDGGGGCGIDGDSGAYNNNNNNNSNTNLTFEQVLFSGYASDGGLFVPTQIPRLSKDTLRSWAGESYANLAKRFLPLFIDEEEMPRQDLESLVDQAFGGGGGSAGGGKFAGDDIAPLVSLKGFHVLELFHGPTLAFKDLALTLVGLFLRYFLKKGSRHVTILVGTSGDTGSASIEAVRGSEMVDIVVLLPRGRCSQIQERQMTSVRDDNVHVFRVDGTSDDLDVPIKRCFDDPSLVSEHNLISLNSINWARVLVQAIHFIYAFLKFNPNVDDDKVVEFLVPTGACGNVSGGCLAVSMGVPMKFVTAVTVNDIVDRAVSSGDFSLSPEVTPTLAPSIDIQVPYNMERIYYFCSNADDKLVKSIMDDFERTGTARIPPNLHESMRRFISGHLVRDPDIISAMQKVWRENEGYVVCPHTAVAVAAFYASSAAGQAAASTTTTTTTSIVVATASPAKFPEALEAAGLDRVVHPRIESVFEMETKFVDLEVGENWTEILKAKILDISKMYASSSSWTTTSKK